MTRRAWIAGCAGAVAALAGVGAAWWSSSAQFDAWRVRVGPAAHHACGPGKTADHLRSAGIANLQVFPSPEAWQQWIARAAR